MNTLSLCHNRPNAAFTVLFPLLVIRLRDPRTRTLRILARSSKCCVCGFSPFSGITWRRVDNPKQRLLDRFSIWRLIRKNNDTIYACSLSDRFICTCRLQHAFTAVNRLPVRKCVLLAQCLSENSLAERLKASASSKKQRMSIFKKQTNKQKWLPCTALSLCHLSLSPDVIPCG